MNPIFVGIDPSSLKLAIVAKTAASQQPLLVSQRKLAEKGHGGSPQACLMAQKFVRQQLSKFAGHPLTVYIEAPIVGRGVHATLVQAFVSGAVQASLSTMTTRVYLVYPATWKAQIVGRGNASKADVLKHIRVVWPPLAAKAGTDQDLIDAGAICLYAERIAGTQKTARKRR